ncbi:magnetosome protein MamS [Magnetovibrio blakemorei]|uniref:Magnetosome protein MamS n=2 Tax=Pseudomonadota TaxID=1224 RepID=C4RAG1_9PROT|nr:magnetosome protein MamS [Magnetovibrio blakemorei]ASN76801.1 MamS [Vibrio sp. MV-1]OEJ67304.1 hypothetical protein BEN30_00275 [Magnetovibrio blakemorei]CAV30806.1 magnetosome protein MamS [Magnetovibrio blakemorei]
MNSGFRPENWIVAGGIVFALGVVAASSLPDTFWSDNNTSPISAQVTNLGELLAPTPDPNATDMAATPQEANVTGLIPFTKASTTRFRGKVVRVMSLGNDTGWGQMHVWISDGAGQAQEISIAPDWYLMHMGCTVTEQAQVQGSAFSFGKPQTIPELYAKSITVDGKTCRLRNDEGFALWSNRLR